MNIDAALFLDSDSDSEDNFDMVYDLRPLFRIWDTLTDSSDSSLNSMEDVDPSDDDDDDEDDAILHLAQGLRQMRIGDPNVRHNLPVPLNPFERLFANISSSSSSSDNEEVVQPLVHRVPRGFGVHRVPRILQDVRVPDHGGGGDVFSWHLFHMDLAIQPNLARQIGQGDAQPRDILDDLAEFPGLEEAAEQEAAEEAEALAQAAIIAQAQPVLVNAAVQANEFEEIEDLEEEEEEEAPQLLRINIVLAQLQDVLRNVGEMWRQLHVGRQLVQEERLHQGGRREMLVYLQELLAGIREVLNLIRHEFRLLIEMEIEDGARDNVQEQIEMEVQVPIPNPLNLHQVENLLARLIAVPPRLVVLYVPRMEAVCGVIIEEVDVQGRQMQLVPYLPREQMVGTPRNQEQLQLLVALFVCVQIWQLYQQVALPIVEENLEEVAMIEMLDELNQEEGPRNLNRMLSDLLQAVEWELIGEFLHELIDQVEENLLMEEEED